MLVACLLLLLSIGRVSSQGPHGNEAPGPGEFPDFDSSVDLSGPVAGREGPKHLRSFAPDFDSTVDSDKFSPIGKLESAEETEDETDETEFLNTLNDLYPINGNHPRHSNQVQHWEDDSDLPLIHQQLPSEEFNKTGQLRYSSVPVVEGELIEDLLNVIFSREDYILLLNNPNRANMEQAVRDMIRGPTQEVLKQQLLHKALASRAVYLKYIEPMLENNKRQQLLDFANHLIEAKKKGILSTNDTILMNEVLTNIAFFDRGDDVQFRGTIDKLLNEFGADGVYGAPEAGDDLYNNDDDSFNATDYEAINGFLYERSTVSPLLITTGSDSTDQLPETTSTSSFVIGESNRDMAYTGYPNTGIPLETSTHGIPRNHTDVTTTEPTTSGAPTTTTRYTRTRGPYDPIYIPPRPRPTKVPVAMTSTDRPMPPVEPTATNGLMTGYPGRTPILYTLKPFPDSHTRFTGYKPTGTTTGPKSTRRYPTTGGRILSSTHSPFTTGYKPTGTTTGKRIPLTTGRAINGHASSNGTNGITHAAPRNITFTEEPLELVKIKNVTSPLADDDVEKIQSILQ